MEKCPDHQAGEDKSIQHQFDMYEVTSLMMMLERKITTAPEVILDIGTQRVLETSSHEYEMYSVNVVFDFVVLCL